MEMGIFNSTKPGNDPTDPAANDLSWVNVGIGFLFVLFDAVLSTVLGLGIGRGLLVAAARCIIQLTVMSKVLGSVFESNNIFAVMGIVLLLENLAAIEGTFNKAKRRYTGMVSVHNRGHAQAELAPSSRGQRGLRGKVEIEKSADVGSVPLYPPVYDVRHDSNLDSRRALRDEAAAILEAGPV